MTFGETVVNVVKISASSDGTAYTVPAGRYAIVKFHRAEVTTVDPSAASITVGGGTLVAASSGGSASLAPGEFALISSNTIVLASSGAGSKTRQFDGVAFEFNNP